MGKTAHTNGTRGHDQGPPESPKQVGLRLRRNSFKGSKSSVSKQKQSSRHNSPGYERENKKQRTGDDVPKSRDSERSPPRIDSPSSAIVTPDTISSKESSSSDGGSRRGCTQFLSRFSAQGSLESFRATIEGIVVEKIEVITNTPTAKSGFETAASIDILSLAEASNPLPENMANIVRRGAMLMEEGQNKVNEGEEMLKSAFKKIRHAFNLT